MHIKQGIPVSHGVAISRAVVLDAEDQPIPRRSIPAARVPIEIERLKQSLIQSRRDVEELRDRAQQAVGDLAKIFDFHIGMLNDASLIGEIQDLIESDQVTAEFAAYSVMRHRAQQLRQLDIPYFQERDRDIWDVERRLIGHLIGRTREELAHLKQDAIIVAHDLTPSQTASLDKQYIKGIATDLGGRTSHTAILAHALGIPAVVGLGNVTGNVTTGEMVIVDGDRGQIIIDPDAAQQFRYRQEQRRIDAFAVSLRKLATEPGVTTDGTNIALYANIEFPAEIPDALKSGAEGIGLYRTEFLFLNSSEPPSEEEQYEAYAGAIKALKGRVMTIRTLDLGADKLMPIPGSAHAAENNPFLGCRSIRYCLQNLELFKTQLRAILRASALGPVRVMFPLISNVMELRQAKMIFSDVKEDLDDQGIAYGKNVPVGIMIEVPSAAIQATVLSREVDFFSIGTNDLIQYTVAVDRGNERVASLYSAGHPAVLQLIKDVVRVGARAKIDVGLCGEMAGEPEFVMLLIGMGMRSLSMTPPAIPEAKKIIRSVSVNQCQRLARKVMSLDTDREVVNYVRDETRKVFPEIVDGRSIE